jgi:hypothetical protein
MVGFLNAALLAASLSGNYDCAIEHQVVVTEQGAGNQEVQFPESQRDAWRFGLRVPNGAASEVTVDWPANPIQIAGTHPSLPVAPGQVAFIATAPGACMFTEQACIALVELSARDDGSAAFSILPAGSSRDAATGARSLLHVVFLGTCRRQNGAARQ